MKTISKISAIAFVLALLVASLGFTPAQAQTQMFAGQIYSFGGAFWTDGGSFIVSSTLDGTFRRTQKITYHVKGTAGNVFVDGGPLLSLDFWPQQWRQVQHIYYYTQVVNLGSPGSWTTTDGGLFPDHGLSYIKGDFDANLGGLNQHWGYGVGYNNWPYPHPMPGVDYIITAIFSLDPITSMTFPAVVNKTGWVLESARGSRIGGSVRQNKIFVGDAASKQGFRSIVQFNTAGLPDPAIITGATITMTMDISNTVGNTVGWGPLNFPNYLTVQIARPCFGACYLQSGDWQQNLNVVTIGYMGPIYNNGTYVAVQHLPFMASLGSINRKGVTEIRLQWKKITDADGLADRVAFRGPGASDPPTITIYFTFPTILKDE